MVKFTIEAINNELDRIRTEIEAKGWSSGVWISLDARSGVNHVTAFFAVGHPDSSWYKSDTHHKNSKMCTNLMEAFNFIDENIARLNDYKEQSLELILEDAKVLLKKRDELSDDWNRALQPLADIVEEQTSQVEPA